MNNPEERQHWVHKTQDEDKQNKKHNTTQKTKEISNTDFTKNCG